MLSWKAAAIQLFSAACVRNFCYRYIALMVLPVDLFHFGELCGGCIRRSGFFRQVCPWFYSTSGTLPADTSAVSVFQVCIPVDLFNLGQFGDGCRDLLVGRNLVAHLAVVVFLVGNEIKVAGAGQTEDNGLLLTGLLALE